MSKAKNQDNQEKLFGGQSSSMMNICLYPLFKKTKQKTEEVDIIHIINK